MHDLCVSRNCDVTIIKNMLVEIGMLNCLRNNDIYYYGLRFYVLVDCNVICIQCKFP